MAITIAAIIQIEAIMETAHKSPGIIPNTLISPGELEKPIVLSSSP